MPHKVYSSGFSPIDGFLGGLNAGESMLFIVPTVRFWREWLAASLDRIPKTERVYALGFQTPPTGARTGRKSIPLLPTIPRRYSLPLLKRQTGKLRAGNRLIVEEFSSFHPSLPDVEHIPALFSGLCGSVRLKKALLAVAVLRAAVDPHILAGLKDAADVVFEGVEMGDDVHLLPVTVKNRYKPGLESRISFPVRKLLRGGQYTETEPPEVATGRIPETSYRDFFDSATEPFILFHRHKAILDANKQALELLNLTRDEFLAGAAVKSIRPPDRFTLFRTILTLGRKRTGGCTILYGEGKKAIPIELNCWTLGDGYVGVALNDVSERSRLEARLRNRSGEVESFFRNLRVPSLFLKEKKITAVSPSFVAGFGYASEGDVLARGLAGLFPPASVSTLRALMRGQETPAALVELNRGDGTIARCSVDLSRVTLNDEEYLHAAFHDLTTLIAERDANGRSAEDFQTTVERSPEPVAILRDRRFAFCNRAFLSLFGLAAAEEVIGKEHAVVEAGDKVDWIAEKCSRRNFQKSGHITHVFTAAMPQGEPKELRVAVAPMDESADALILYYRDVSLERRTEEHSRRLSADLELLNASAFTLKNKHDLDRSLHTALHQTMEVFSWNCGGIYTLSENGAELRLRHQRGLPQKLAEALAVLPAKEGLGGYVTKTQEPCRITVDRYPTYLPHRAVFQSTELASVALVPLLAGEGIEGMLLLGSRRGAPDPRFSAQAMAYLGRELGASIQASARFTDLERAAAEYGELLDGAREIFYRLSPEGGFEYVSPNVEALLGYTPREFRRNRSLWISMVHPDDKRLLLERVTTLEELQDRSTIEYRILRRGKATHITVRDTLIVRRGASGAIEKMLGTVIDVSAEHEAAEQMKEDLQSRDAMIDALQDAVAGFDGSMALSYCNAEFERLFGGTSETLVGKEIPLVLPVSLQKRVAESVSAALRGEVVTTDDLRLPPARDQEERLLRLTVTPVPSELGIITGAVCQFTDITLQKSRETELRSSEQVLRNVIDTMGDIFIITDLKGSVKQCNKAFQRILGYTYEEALNADFPYPWLVEEEMSRYVLWIANLREKNWLHDFDMTWHSKDGSMIPVSLSTTLLRDAAGTPVAMLNIARDITERVRLMKDIERRNKELDDFTYVVSHDLKEPLISIEGFSRILYADYYTMIGTDGKEYLDSIVGATTRMKNLIDDLLMLSRVSRPSEAFRAVSMAAVMDEIRKDMMFTIRQRGVQLVIPDALPSVWGYETHLKILFRNLIGNAIKFNTQKAPVVEVGFRNEENNYYLFSVKDNGIGIDPEFHEKIFVIFQRLHRRDEYEGTGAGLAIVKKIVEMHKGTIWVESEPGKGSTFFLTLPAAPVA